MTTILQTTADQASFSLRTKERDKAVLVKVFDLRRRAPIILGKTTVPQQFADYCSLIRSRETSFSVSIWPLNYLNFLRCYSDCIWTILGVSVVFVGVLWEHSALNTYTTEGQRAFDRQWGKKAANKNSYACF